MSTGFILWLLCLVVVLWLISRVGRLSKALEDEKQNYIQLQHKFNHLEHTLKTRGKRLDVLLSTVTEAVLRVDKFGRVLGGNTQANDLFQFDQFSEMPQSMLVFYRDTDWLMRYQQAIGALPQQLLALPEMKVKGRVLLPRLAALGDHEALLLCMDITAYVQLQAKQKSLLENLMHDLKTPLTSLLGYARSIETFADDEELRLEAVSVIAHEAKHINDLMNSMLTLNQIEYQSIEVIEPCDLLAVHLQVWDAVQVQMKSKNIELVIVTKLKAAKVNMCEADCYRVILNIADNALKYSPKGSTVESLIEPSENGISVIIKDSGYGIADKHLSRVTDRFYRIDDVRGRIKEDGHGLGLAIVKETLERDGGSLKLANRKKGGLQVTLCFPIVQC